MSLLDDKLQSWKSATEVSPPPELLERIVLEAPRATLAPLPKPARRWPWLLAAFVGLGGALGLYGWREPQPAAAVAPVWPQANVEPTRLTTEEISDSFGYGGDVKWVNPDEKRFSFALPDPDRAVVVVHLVGKEIFQAEVDVLVNGTYVTHVPAGTGDQEIILPRRLLKAGENEVLFDNAFSPPRTAWWSISKLRLELVSTPESTLLASARKRLAVAERQYEQREVAGNLDAAWAGAREARVVLEAGEGEKPPDHARAVQLEKTTNDAFNRLCSWGNMQHETDRKKIRDALANLRGPGHRCFDQALKRHVELMREDVGDMDFPPRPWWQRVLSRASDPSSR